MNDRLLTHLGQSYYYSVNQTAMEFATTARFPTILSDLDAALMTPAK